MDQPSRAMLVVESDPNRRIRLAEFLSKHHVSVLLAPDLSTAQSIVKNQRVAAVVLDAQTDDHGRIRDGLCLHGLDVDTPFLVLDESSPSDSLALSWIDDAPPSQHTTTASRTMSAGSQTSLLYALPHEYRTPLTDIIGQSAFLHGHAPDMTSEEIRESSTDILRSARRLLRITDNFLLFAQLEAFAESPFHIQRMRQFSTPCAGTILREAVRERAQARDREGDMTCNAACHGVTVRIMPQYLANIIGELVDNACAFSLPGAPINVAMDWDDNTLTIRVTDSGVGMSDEECASVGPYRQFRRSLQEQQGVGLGLTIAQRLTEFHGGTLTIHSVQHVGTTVLVSLPRADVRVTHHVGMHISVPPTQMVLACA